MTVNDNLCLHLPSLSFCGSYYYYCLSYTWILLAIEIRAKCQVGDVTYITQAKKVVVSIYNSRKCCRFNKHWFRFGMHIIGLMLLCDIACLTQIFFHLTILINTMCEQRARTSFEYWKGIIIEEEHVQAENIKVCFYARCRVIATLMAYI